MSMSAIDKRVRTGLVLSVIGTVLCPLLGVFPLILSIIALCNNKTKRKSSIIGWAFILLVVEGVLLVVGSVHIVTTLLNAKV